MGTLSIKLSASPPELRSKFYGLKTPKDVADLLEIDLQRLYYHIYIVPESSRYTTFDILKRHGGFRTISAPVTALKIIQRKLNQVLLQTYSPKPCVHSFLLDKSILTNAKRHVAKKRILNIDLQDFFPSINFGRVRGLFMGVPYNLNSTVATILAQICCSNNQLPQGAPTSPIVSNMICAKMDSQLMALARDNKCDYTRYVDDIVFSTNLGALPTALVTVNDLGQTEVGAELERIIKGNGFKINPDKVRVRGKNLRQQVTGITVNKFPNVRRRFIRQIRAMLHAWGKFGLDAAQEEFDKHWDRKHRSSWKGIPSFKQVVKGKIEFLGMIRGKNDPIYIGLCKELRDLAPELVPPAISLILPSVASTTVTPLVMTEGKSDCSHLKAALQALKEKGRYVDLGIEFYEHESGGDDDLLTTCKKWAMRNNEKPVVFIFDRDNDKIAEEVCPADQQYKAWGNNVFSFRIPVPTHRTDTPKISIELYYQDHEITREDEKGRRLFLSNEFDAQSGRDTSGDLNCVKLHLIKKKDRISIIDSGVYNTERKNVALPKADFAEYVLNKEKDFDNFDFSEFAKIFDVVLMIVKAGRV